MSSAVVLEPGNKAGQSKVVAVLKHWTGLDRAIGLTVLARGWAAGAGFVTVLLIARFLTAQEQGYYYTFGSLLGLQVIFELGFSFVILQFASHESAHLAISGDGTISGDSSAHDRLAAILQKALRWYAVMAVFMAFSLVPAGIYFFSRNVHQMVEGWRGPWITLVLIGSFNLCLIPVLGFLEGCGFVPQVAGIRLGQAVLGSALAWAALIAHHGLLSPAMLLAGQFLWGVFAVRKWRVLLVSLARHSGRSGFLHWSEIWPFQWRIAVSWLCSYFIVQLFNPVLFAVRGPVEAGRMGMSLSIVTALGTVALAWLNTKAAPFGRLVAERKFKELDRVFFRTLVQSFALLFAACAATAVLVVLLPSVWPEISGRLLPPVWFIVLLTTTLLNHIVFSEALYLRAHKQESFLVLSVLIAITVGASTIILAQYFGASGVCIGYLVGSGLLGIAVGTWIFQTKRKEWHEVAAEC